MSNDQRLDQADSDETGDTWVTVSIHPPSPNCHFAGFVVTVNGELRAEARAVDFMALQELAPDDDDEPPAGSRIIPIVIDWTGAVVPCAPELNNGFAALAPSAAQAEERTRVVIKAMTDAQAPAATP